jgi:hypothetical protein
MFANFKEVVLQDFEYEAVPGENPTPICLAMSCEAVGVTCLV